MALVRAACLIWLWPRADALMAPKKTARAQSRLAAAAKKQASFACVLIGCGLPGRGMGWFHGLQLVEGACPAARLTDVVEPWFLGSGAETPAGQEFGALAREWSSKYGVAFRPALDASTWAGTPLGSPRVALISGRTAENPGLFRAALDAGATHILLEKPGAPSVSELKDLAALAAAKHVPVCMGFIKNLAPYFTRALTTAQAHPGALVTLVNFNDYTEANLGECFERNSEGLLQNMAIHELALAASFFGMTAKTVADVAVDSGACDLRTIGGLTDFVKVDFTLTNLDGTRLRIVADRCGGDNCAAVVSDADGGVVLQELMVDAAAASSVAARRAAHPTWITYLLAQEPHYAALKERCAEAFVAGKVPDGVATIQVAVDALELAEYLTPILRAKLA
ncbi:hypothetical protein M885DRAFT_581705 [Pelagophyceae sp. CCMP2097]|nr:hypothetical protein M885DRAFT_581705 [Pelagophyceae sp. CCMP2097]